MTDSASSRVISMVISDEMRQRFHRVLKAHSDGLEKYASLLLSFNKRHNLISRNSEAFLFERHIAHALALAVKSFHRGAVLADWGSGGGLPAIPISIAQQDIEVVAIDAVEKKMRAVQAMSKRLGLQNMTAWHGRAEEWSGQCEYSISRATAPLLTLWMWHVRTAIHVERTLNDDTWKPGLLCLKGGDLKAEILLLLNTFKDCRIEMYHLAPLLEHAYFQEKVILHVHE